MSFLQFEQTGTSESGKTKIWDVKSTTGAALARIGWYGPWRKYTAVFYPSTVFDASCLTEISDFLLKETSLHRKVAILK